MTQERKKFETLHLFPLLNERLIAFLRGLSREDWMRQTVAKKWVIKDVAAHLLDVNLRRISLHDHQWGVPPPERPITSNQDLVDFLNGLNGDWVNAMRRLSPEIITDLLESSNEKVYQVFKSLDPDAPSTYPVSWAGDEVSTNRFDIAREYTERWHHQQQIREAMGNDDLLAKEFYRPMLDIFMEAWPVSLSSSSAKQGTILAASVTGEGGGAWFARITNGKWQLVDEAEGIPVAETKIDGDIAWKLFSKSLRRSDIEGKYNIVGDQELGGKVLDMISVMA